MPPELPVRDSRAIRDSYSWCRQLCRQSKSSFFASFGLLDPPRRRAMYALYAFARITDDLGDSLEPASLRRQQLEAWRKTLQQRLLTTSNGEPPQHSQPWLARYASLWPGLHDAVTTFDIQPQLLLDIVHGVCMDIDHRPPNDWEQLQDYCYHVASAVGLACGQIWRAVDPLPTDSAIQCGIAFQLTNILRDLGEDARLGRIYIPLSELERFGIDRQRWLAGAPDGRWRELVDSVAAEAARKYELGWPTINALTPRSQRMFSLMWHSYRQLLSRIEADKQAVWSQTKIRLPFTARLSLLTSHSLPVLYRQLSRRRSPRS